MGLMIYLVPADITISEYPKLINPCLDFDIGLFDKLEPVWEFCRGNGGQAGYFQDFLIEKALIQMILKDREKLISAVIERKPFGQQANQEAIDFFSMLQQTQKTGNVVLGLCD